MNRWSPYFLSVLRVIAAFVYGVHGAQKLFGFPAPFPVPHQDDRDTSTGGYERKDEGERAATAKGYLG